jgi:2-hydroxychromene-2-carboxylate isomerase
VAFFYDLACPFSYFAAERVERLLGEVDWIPVAGEATGRGRPTAELRARAERRAAELRLPLEWPDRFSAGVPGALRTAVRAEQVGAGARFGLAAARLAFCGGFDLEDPEVLAAAAAAAGLTLDDCLAAAGDRSLDATLDATARGLRAQGVRELPAVRAGRHFHQGERGLAETVAQLRGRADYVRPLAPVG